MKKTVFGSLIMMTVLFAVFISGILIGRHSATAIPLADVSDLIPTKPFEPDDMPLQEMVGNKININTASAETMAVLPGLSVKTAVLIVEYREKNGPFSHIEQLLMIEGLGEKRFRDIAKYITVGD